MRKLFCSVLIIVSLLISSFNLEAQVYNGDATLTTQAQVDAFNYTSVTGRLIIEGQSTGEILNVDGLSKLTSVGKGLFIENNSALTNLDGLSHLTSVGDALDIEENFALTNIDGLSSLTSIGGAMLFLNDIALTNVNGLSSVTSIGAKSSDGGLNFTQDLALTNLDGLSQATANLNFISLKNNNQLINVDGLSNISVIGSLDVENNFALASINGLSKVALLFFDLTLVNNSALPNVDGLSNLQSVKGKVEIKSNAALTNLDGLSKLTSIGGIFFIGFNPALTNIDGLSNLGTVGGHLNITANPNLANLNGLSSLTSVGGNFGIGDDDLITNLDGLSKLTSVALSLGINNNAALIDFCGLYNLFHSGTIGGSISITNNGANTVSVTATDITVNADPDVCSALISDATIGTAATDGCLVPITTTHTSFPAGNIFSVGNTYITWTATDAANNSATAVQTITVVDNQPPTISCPASITVSCASDVPAVDISSAAATDNCSYVVTHVGDVITNQTCANRFTLTRTYRATDGAGNSAECLQVITVNDDQPPQLTDPTVSQSALWPPNHTMRDITLTYTVSDNCSATTSVSITSNEPVNGVSDGDTDPDWEIVDDHHIKLRAERAANGDGRIYTITVTVTDGCNSPVTKTATVMVAHNITGPVTGHPFKIGSTVDFAGTFWDKPGNKHTVSWLIDDNTLVKGSVIEPTAAKTGKATGSYKFTTAGVYKLQMNITDQNKITSYANTNGDVEEIIVVYDPSGGYAYGGGWFNSPAGALKSDPSAIGKVSYGFTTNYFKNSTYPKGETQFEFKVGSLEFNALNFDYLSISGAKAQLKGTGKIVGGQSGINFIMTVIDGDLDGSGVDKIRMKIYNKNTGQVYYDNEPGISDAANPTTAVGLNSSVVVQNTNITSAQKNIANEEVMNVVKELDVRAIPNPSNNNFTLTIRSNGLKDKITMQAVDMYGRVIEVRNVAAEQTITLGDKYRAGTYFVKFIQGENRKQLKLVKL